MTLQQKMMAAAARDTAETQAAIWTAEKMSDMRTDALVSASDLYEHRWGKKCAALVEEIARRG